MQMVAIEYPQVSKPVGTTETRSAVRSPSSRPEPAELPGSLSDRFWNEIASSPRVIQRFYTMNNNPTDDTPLSVKDICARLKCGRTIAFNLLRTGEIKSFTVGGRLRRTTSTFLDEYVRRQITSVPRTTDAGNGIAAPVRGERK